MIKLNVVLIIILVVVLYVSVKLWKIKEQNNPENIIDRCEDLAFRKEKEFLKAKDEAMESMSGATSKEAKNNIKDIEKIGITQNKLQKLNIHLQEKYKTDYQKRISVWNDYIDWLTAQSIVFNNRTHIGIMDIDDFWNDNNEQFLKSKTIETKMIDLADKDILEVLKI